MPGEPALGRWQQVEPKQAQVTPGCHQRLVVAKQPGDAVGKADGQGLIKALTLTVGLQRRQVTGRLRPGEQGFRQGLHVTQRQVEALPGNRVQAVRRIAQHHQVRTHLFLRLDQ